MTGLFFEKYKNNFARIVVRCYLKNFDNIIEKLVKYNKNEEKS